MKILAIRGKNLASLNGEFEIDFSSQPLKDAGIFAITGPTGSGKSTLLDALCLALYDSTPRLNKARENNVSLEDVNGKRINQYDTRSILRRGTAEGYSEVDFLSVTGDTFRSTWIVRRGRGQVTGSLQNVEIRLTNLSTGEEEKGTKTELLDKISRYVGLTFEQFNRSVLLAQGDFAMFLKAKQSEKAEILEKLTGTEIYSRISTIIYNKSRDVIMQQKSIQEKIDDIALLSDDEFEELKKEQLLINEHLSTYEKDQQKIINSQKWISDENLLKKAKDDASQELIICQKLVDEAAPRFKQIEEVDSVQPVRELFFHLKSNKNQKEINESSLELCKKEYSNDLSTLEKAKEDVEILKKEIKTFEEESAKLEPSINRARELDIQVIESSKQLEELEKENKKNDDSKQQIIKSIGQTNKGIEEYENRLLTINSWFERYKKFESLIPAVALVISVLDGIDGAKKNIVQNNSSFELLKKRKEETEKVLAEKKEEQERLNKILPSEVIMLRNELIDGEPCPVCGSTHHPYRKEIVQALSLKEEELNRSKENIEKDIDRLTKEIEEHNNNLTRFDLLIENDKKLIEKSITNVSKYVSIIPNWEELLEKSELKNAVGKFETQWNDKLSEQASFKETIIKLKAQKDGLTHELESIEQQINEKHKNIIEAKAQTENNKNERALLFNGRATDMVVKELGNRQKEMTLSLETLITKQHNLAVKAESNKTKIAELDKEISRFGLEIGDDDKKINDWITIQNNSLTREHLETLMNIDMTNVVNERKALSVLMDNKMKSESILKERELKLLSHGSSEDRPSEDENAEILSQKLEEIKSKLSSERERSATILVQIERNNTDRTKKNKFLKELDKIKVKYENWSGLNTLFGSMSGDKFKEIAQGYTLDVLLFYANKHLEDLAPRYKLERITDTLALQIVDLDMLGETRSVHSLSGGESFLVSLALALGLSSLSSNKMNVESLFIDEGFGSLDIDTLRIAMDALERLQMQGRKIGVISHVEEMTERIAVQIEVRKEGNGTSKIFVNS